MKKVGFFRSIQLKFIVIFILLLLIAIQIIGSYFVGNLEEKLKSNFMDSINDRVEYLSSNLEQAFAKERIEGEEGVTLEEDVQSIVSDVDPADITSLQVVDLQGRVLGTNDISLTDSVGKKTSNPLILDVLLFGTTKEKVYLDSESGERKFVRSVSLKNNSGEVVGAIFLEASMASVYKQLENINQIFLQGSILAVTVSALIGILIARTITKPIKEMRRQAQTMAKGDFSQKVNVYSLDEIGNLAETFNDLNDRLRHSQATTEEERRKLSSVLSNMSDGVIATDHKGAVTLMNDAAAKLVEEDPDDIKGRFLLDVLQLSDKIVDISELQDTGSMIIDYSDEDDIFLVRANFSIISNEYEEITGFITVISDVTEQEKAEQERREFVSNVSHELRTPLTTMRSYIEALTEGAWEDKEIAPKFLGVTQNETERMIRMVNDLLQLSKMDHKEYGLHKERTDFISYLHQIIDRFDMNVSEKIDLKRDLPGGQYFVYLDKDKMTQVLDNIISNAIKYSPDGGSIRFKVEKQKYQLIISIKDDGPGIAYEKLDKIFERFYRADKARNRKVGGTGLGLAIAKELVEAHHGRIWAKSKEGKGTTILFTLPLMNQKRRNIS
ncbi:cell wall metabolism sensor histidine kinase WalK [Virgibacillus phasianinus]|uniref:histidine kinase n=1 Tax=Virgibacillus phasianinus TaxID=2017483 RepID=A0A220U1J2_9BACI|nr:cell wall metabolism sensor histidine kinase WalK [Virgibacillus phasianinus]ASK61796.1 cell wall metabolism sensor histidine kinase WalK [Virgibacillus phasianinus]